MAEYIEREALIYAITSVANGEFIRDFKSVALRIISEQPAADVEEIRHGKWKFVEGVELGLSKYMCSECGYNDIFINAGVHRGVYRYCPQCGARMDFGGVKNEN